MLFRLALRILRLDQAFLDRVPDDPGRDRVVDLFDLELTPKRGAESLTPPTVSTIALRPGESSTLSTRVSVKVLRRAQMPPRIFCDQIVVAGRVTDGDDAYHRGSEPVVSRRASG